MTQTPHEWRTNPGDNWKTPDPDLDPDTLVQVRYDDGFPTTGLPANDFHDVGRVEDFYWQIDNDLGDVRQYRLMEAPDVE